MLGPTKVIEIDLCLPLADQDGLAGNAFVQALCRWRGHPIGYVRVPVINGGCSSKSLRQAALDQHSPALIRTVLRTGLQHSPPTLDFPAALKQGGDLESVESSCCPTVTVAVCTRNRKDELERCLESLSAINYRKLDVLVVENQPTNEDVRLFLKDRYPAFRYVSEPRPGLSFARNKAILESSSEIVAFTDDDVVVDTQWVRALVAMFADSPEVGAVTGLIAPMELETEAQSLFELYGTGSFGLGFERRWFRFGESKPDWSSLGTGRCGAGANMAFRRTVFSRIGLFDPALGAGSLCGSAEDTQMFFRVLQGGYSIAYDPGAIVRHRHRSRYEDLRAQLRGYGGVAAFYAWGLAIPRLRLAFLRLIVWHLMMWNCARLTRAVLMPSRLPPELLLEEMRGTLRSLFSYRRSRRLAEQIDGKSGLPKQAWQRSPGVVASSGLQKQGRKGASAIRHIDISRPLQAVVDVAEYAAVRLFVWYKQKPVGSVDINNHYATIGVMQLSSTISDALTDALVNAGADLTKEQRLSLAVACLITEYLGDEPIATGSDQKLPASTPISIVIPTCNRKEELRSCLKSLSRLRTERPLEVIVVDNAPSANLIDSIRCEFSDVRFIVEPRTGSSYARNAGVAASSSDIIVFIDDDTAVPPDWLENLIAPFARADVMAVTGNIIPRELETESQRTFEGYADGGLNRGYARWDADSDWFYVKSNHSSPPTWLLGGTGNAAFRAAAFCHPRIGLMEEVLGAGTPTGSAEDIYLFYRTLREGWTVAYEPKACLSHSHRSSMDALHKQLFCYSKGFVAYQLILLLRERDTRSLKTLFLVLPHWHLKRVFERLIGRSSYPLRLVIIEMAGGLCGPCGLLFSYLRVLGVGRSAPYVAPPLRHIATSSPRVLNLHEELECTPSR